MRKALLLAVAAFLLFHASTALAQPVGGSTPQYAQRRARYAAAHPELNSQQLKIALNLKLDEESYTNVVTMQKPGDLAVFVSKHYALPLYYVPSPLVTVEETYAMPGVQLREDCYKAFISMVHAMEQEGLSLYIKVGYRMNVPNDNPKDMWNAWPGHSEHQTGLAFDLRLKDETHRLLREYEYEKTAEYAWLCVHACEHGFILTYPEGKTGITGFEFEPWHWRYVGTAIAQDMKAKGFSTFHEYWAAYLMQSAVKPEMHLKRERLPIE